MKFIQLFTFLCVLFPLTSFADSAFPFEVHRDANGKLEKIVLPKKAAAQMAIASTHDLLTELKSAYIEVRSSENSLMLTTSQGIEAPKASYRKLLGQSHAALLNELNVESFENRKLVEEFDKAKGAISKSEWFRLLAAPNNPQAFDEEKILVQLIKSIMDNAKKVIDVGGPLTIFEFLVDEYFESLQSRREFYQNQLIYWVLNEKGRFSEEEKRHILSSVYYSRIAIERLDLRKKALKDWANFGGKKYLEAIKRCKGFLKDGDESFGACFKVDDHFILNAMAKRHSLSKQHSVAFDYDDTYAVRNLRSLILIVKLGTRLLPGLGPAKQAFFTWLNSFYKTQRKSEGFLYGHLMWNGEVELAKWVLVNSANPMIEK